MKKKVVNGKKYRVSTGKKKKTPFVKGNTYWMRSDKGRDKIFATPEELWDTFVEYTKYVDRTPWVVGEGKKAQKRRTPYSLMGFVVYCCTSEDYFYVFKSRRIKEENNTKLSEKDRKDASAFVRVINEIQSVIRHNQFDGAAARVFREGLMTKVLELVDKKDITTNGKEIGPIPEIKVYNTAPPLASSEKEVTT